MPLSLLHALLTDEGYRTLRCRPRGVVDAHVLVKRFQPALVILDSWLRRHGDGWELLTRVSTDLETADIPVIVITDEPELLSVHAEARRAMHCQVLPKPFDRPNLLTAIERFLGPSPAMHARGDRRYAPFSVASCVVNTSPRQTDVAARLLAYNAIAADTLATATGAIVMKHH